LRNHKFPWHECNVSWVTIENVHTCKIFTYEAWSKNPTPIC
jgi:hypothetical protein